MYIIDRRGATPPCGTSPVGLFGILRAAPIGDISLILKLRPTSHAPVKRINSRGSPSSHSVSTKRGSYGRSNAPEMSNIATLQTCLALPQINPRSFHAGDRIDFPPARPPRAATFSLLTLIPVALSGDLAGCSGITYPSSSISYRRGPY